MTGSSCWKSAIPVTRPRLIIDERAYPRLLALAEKYAKPQVLEAMQGYLRQVGVTLTIVNAEWGTLSQMAAQPVDKNPIQAAFFGWRSVNGDIDSAIQDFGSAFWRPKGNNLSFWKHEEFDRLLAFEQGTVDAKKRLEALHRMQEILMDELPALWLYGEPQIWAARRTLKGVTWNPLESIQSLHAAYFED